MLFSAGRDIIGTVDTAHPGAGMMSAMLSLFRSGLFMNSTHYGLCNPLPRRATSRYITGVTIRLSSVDETSPPIITQASGAQSNPQTSPSGITPATTSTSRNRQNSATRTPKMPKTASKMTPPRPAVLRAVTSAAPPASQL
jgi:hypothetical protein